MYYMNMNWKIYFNVNHCESKLSINDDESNLSINVNESKPSINVENGSLKPSDMFSDDDLFFHLN